MIESGLLLAGVEQAAQSGQTFEVLCPASEQPLATVARGDATDIDAAVAAARSGFEQWSALAPGEREAALLRAADIVECEGEQRYLDLLIDESGSTISKARFEISYTVDLLRTAAGEARRLYAETFPNDNPQRLSMVVREPLGVIAVISPYNAPLALLTKMAGFAVAAGNALVIKPSEETPLIAVAFGKLLVEAGVPAAAVNVITGLGADCGGPLVEHVDIDGIAMTGSTATGQQIGARGMQRMLPMQLELGGKSALLVLGDFEPGKAAAIAAQGLFNHAGQICMANSRVLVERSIYAEFCAELKKYCESMLIGDQRDPATAYGPLINRRSLEKAQAHQQEALAAGATLLTGGEVLAGLVYQPTVLLDTPRHCQAWCEETFAPIMNVVAVDDFEQAVTLANDSDYGLSAGVLTYNYQLGLKACRAIRAGSVHIGMHPFQSNALAPIGGYGMSGLGRSGGHFSTEEFTQLKWISFELGD
ncbi:MAG: aldehyde dehydrogenase family protein [Halieaceae bacterium]